MHLSDLDELLAHQVPEPFAGLGTRHPHWRESYFFVAHRRDRIDDVVVLAMAAYPQNDRMDAIQMARLGGVHVVHFVDRALDGRPDRSEVGPVAVDIVRPYEEIHLRCDPDLAPVGIDLTFRARTRHYGLRRGTMRAGDDIVWDQRHMFQSGSFTGTLTHDGRTIEVDDWWGQRDHSWGVRDHARCPLWLWFQVQLPDGFLGVWHWELANGARVYTDGCWAPATGEEPVPLVDFAHDLEWVGDDGSAASFGANGDGIAGLRGSATFSLADGRRIRVDADGRFDLPYEPFRRGGLSQMQVTTDDGRAGTAIFEVTGAHHHRYFPDTEIPPGLPT